MASKTINTVTDPAGVVHKRTSSSGRAYKFAVIEKNGDGSWSPATWNGRRDLAEYEFKRRVSLGYANAVDLKIVPVTVEEKAVKEKPDVSIPEHDVTRGGIEYKSMPDGHRHRNLEALYRDYRIRIWSSGKSFRAQATHVKGTTSENPLPYWATTLWTACGSLETRQDKIKWKIDEAHDMLAKKIEPARSWFKC